MLNPNELKSGFHYFVMGWHYITQKRFASVCYYSNFAQYRFALWFIFGFLLAKSRVPIDWVMILFLDWHLVFSV